MALARELRGEAAYLDSNVFIYAFEGRQDPTRAAAGELLRDAARRLLIARTSVIARAEVLVRPLRLRQTELADRYRMLLSGRSMVNVYAVDDDIIALSAELRAGYSALKLADALHVATAVRAHCDVFVTADQRLRVVAPRIAVSVLG